MTQALLQRGWRVAGISRTINSSNAKGNHAEFAKFHPLGRIGEVSDVVDAVLYLQNATFVTGENIRVDGGIHAGR